MMSDMMYLLLHHRRKQFDQSHSQRWENVCKYEWMVAIPEISTSLEIYYLTQ
jgi:hypothetical protein